jgi:hypothetical protein
MSDHNGLRLATSALRDIALVWSLGGRVRYAPDQARRPNGVGADDRAHTTEELRLELNGAPPSKRSLNRTVLRHRRVEETACSEG